VSALFEAFLRLAAFTLRTGIGDLDCGSDLVAAVAKPGFFRSDRSA
jgi:hypothetical protein